MLATVDVITANLKAFMDDSVMMKFTGESVDTLRRVNPSHFKHIVSNERGDEGNLRDIGEGTLWLHKVSTVQQHPQRTGF